MKRFNLAIVVLLVLMPLIVAVPFVQGAEDEAASTGEKPDADELARELANPATPKSSLVNHLEYKTYSGDLPGADAQDSKDAWIECVHPPVFLCPLLLTIGLPRSNTFPASA